MVRQLKIKKVQWFITLGLAITMLAASVTWVMAQTEGVIQACMNLNDGTIRIVSDTAECKKNENLLSWNIMGPIGAKGDSGLPGPAGETGAVGPVGPAGLNGLACWDLNGDNIQAEVEDINQDGLWNASDCQGLQGETGAAGAQGPQGPQGEKGPQGEVGLQGPIGLIGPQGERGQVGLTGAVGPRGEQGLQGFPGPQGEPGLAGPGIASIDELEGVPCQVGQPGEGVIALSYDTTTGNVEITCRPTTLYTLTIVKTGTLNSGVFSSPAGISCGSTCSFSFPAGRLIELSNYLYFGDKFVGWGGACSGSGVCQVVMNSDTTVTAAYVTEHKINLGLYFQEVPYPIHTIASGMVVVNGSHACGYSTCAYPFPEGQTVTLQAIAGTGSHFERWEGICDGEPTNTCIVTIDNTDPLDMEVFALFYLNP